MRLKWIYFFLLFPLFIFSQSSWNMNLLGSLTYPNTNCSDIWGWEDGMGNEYALVGLKNGFSCVDVTNPTSPIEEFFISDINSTWRDIKTWGNYAYITTEANAGLLIVDLTDLTGNTYWHITQFNNSTTSTSINFTSAHNIYIDENGIAYIFGARNNGSYVANGGAVFLDVNANATSPEYLGEWTGQYIHDGMTRGDTMYAGCVYAGKLFVVDVSNKSNPQTLGQHTTPNNFTHNAWVSNDGNYVFTTDEQSDAYLAAYDISNINNIQEVDRIQSNPGSNSIPHNTHVDGNFLITSYYRDGTIVHDITYPNHMVQVAYYDSYADSGNGFNGCWGTYPFLSSGNIISSDRDSYNGKGILNIYGRAFQQACHLMGTVKDAINGNNLASANISILSISTTTSTNIIGDYQTAVVDSGTYQVVFSKNGYIPDTLSILLDNGIMTILNAQLYPIGSGCTDPLSCNYDSLATINDSSCIYPIIWQQAFSICDGDSVIVGNSVYDTTGNYSDTLNAANGCDSILYTNISIIPPIIWQQAFSICDGDSVVVGNSVYDTTGNYSDTLNAANGCDSILYTNISIIPSIIWQQAFSICDGDSIVVGSSIYDTSGYYTDTLNAVNGCDTIIYTNIYLVYQHTSSYDTLSVTASIVWNGDTLTVSGNYAVTLTNSVGCDSIANLNLTISPTGILNVKDTKKTLLRVTDILGREIPYKKRTPLFYIYDDGTVVKKIIIE